MQKSLYLFFKTSAVSWFVLGCAALLLEIARPSFVDTLVPIWFIFVVAGASGIAVLLSMDAF